MKKLLSVLLTVALLLTMCSVFSVSADTQILAVGEYPRCCISWDNIYRDSVLISGAGNAYPYAVEHDRIIGGPAEVLKISGWYGADQPIAKFGYTIDGGEPVLSEEYLYKTEDAVIRAAAANGCEYAQRFIITVDVSGITALIKLVFLVQLEDGTVVELGTPAQDVWFEYSGDGSAAPTEAPTAEPPADAGDPVPGLILVFDEDEKYEGFFNTSVQVENIYFDAERGCEVFSFGKVSDPSVTLPFSLLSVYGFDEINAEDYPYIQIGVKFDPAICDDGQFYFQTSENLGFDEPKDIHFSYHDTTERQFLNLFMGKNNKWVGTVGDCRFDFIAYAEEEDAHEFEIYYVAFFKGEEGANIFGNEWLEKGSAALPTVAPTPTKAPTPEPTATPEVTEAPAATEAPAVTEAPAATDAPTNAATPANNNNGNGNKGLSGGAIAGIAIGGVVLLAAIAGIVIAATRKKKK